MSKILQKTEDLEKQLQEQIEILKTLAESYDQGKTVTAKPMATTIRVLLHDTDKSKSLLGQLNMKGVNFFDSCSGSEIFKGNTKRYTSFSCLASVGNKKYIPKLDDSFMGKGRYLAFDEYWNKVVLIDGQNREYTRKYIVTKIANQDGGAHVSPVLDKKYAELTKNNSMGWTFKEGKEEHPVENIELATIRQIAHETIRTLDPNYPFQKMVTQGEGLIIGGVVGVIVDENKEVSSFGGKITEKVGRNEKCPCGSKIKYKKCHGK